MGAATGGSDRQDAGAGATPSRRLAAIMFTDLVGYSALSHSDEALALELLERHRGWIREILPRHGGREISTIGDAFLIEFANALAAVECALAIQAHFVEYNAAAPLDRRMEVRVGIHLGDVESDGRDVLGDGVNIASRIHGMARPGGVCVSEQVYHAVRNRKSLSFRSLGTPKLKNISTSLELFALEPGTGRLAGTSAPRRRIPRSAWMGAAGVIAGIAGVAALAALYPFFAQRPAGDPSVAVLPFENLSVEPESAYFTDGLHDTVIGHLARVRNLKVTSRASVMGYRDKRANLRDIARELGVAHVVEGSVQRAEGRLRVVVQLIDTASDTHVWSNEYDRELKDVFAVQADIAQHIAAAVHVQLTPRQQAEIARAPTVNAQAYDLYLRARAAVRKSELERQDLQRVIALLDEAIALDAGFALAYAERGKAHDTLYWYGFDPTEARRKLAADDIAEALRLDPGLAQVHLARARLLSHGGRRAEALSELEIAREIAPGDSQVHGLMGGIHRSLGRWDDALLSFEHAVSLDPLNGGHLYELGWTLEMLGRYVDADRVYARLEAAEPGRGFGSSERAEVHFRRTGDLGPLERFLEQVPAGFDPLCEISAMRWQVRLLRRQFREAAEAIMNCADPYVGSGAGQRAPKEFFAAMAHWLAGDADVARQFGGRARPELDQSLADDEDRPLTRMRLAQLLLVLGERAAAFAEGQRAVQAMPVTRNAPGAARMLAQSAMLHAMGGEHARALLELEQALALPGGEVAHFVRLHPAYDGLRNEQRFQELMQRHLPKGEGT